MRSVEGGISRISPAARWIRDRHAAEVRDAVDVVPDREDARVVLEAQVDQDVERPQRARDDRVAGGAEAAHGLPSVILEQVARRAARRRETPRGPSAIDEPVREAVARHLMAAAGDLGDQARPALGDPAENEERRARVGGVEQVEQPWRVGVDPLRQIVPARRRRRRRPARWDGSTPRRRSSERCAAARKRSPIHPVHGAGRLLPPAEQHDLERAHHDVEIQQEREVLQVVEVELELARECSTVGA